MRARPGARSAGCPHAAQAAQPARHQARGTAGALKAIDGYPAIGPLTLTAVQRRDLAAILRLCADERDRGALDRAIADVEKWLGFYHAAVVSTATAPRAEVKRGKPANDVLMKVIAELRRVFQRSYRVDKEAAPAGKKSALLPWQQAEVDFVETALDFGRIAHFDNIRRHLSAPGAGVLHEGDRLSQIEKIAAKVRQARSRPLLPKKSDPS